MRDLTKNFSGRSLWSCLWNFSVFHDCQGHWIRFNLRNNLYFEKHHIVIHEGILVVCIVFLKIVEIYKNHQDSIKDVLA